MNQEQLCAIIRDNGDIQFQDSWYIDSGCYIVSRNGIFELWEISNSDDDFHVGDFKNIKEAIEQSRQLT